MSEIVLALAPVFLLIALGNVIRRTGLLSEGFWAGAERLVYWGLFPCLLFRKTATAPLENLSVGPMAVTLLVALCVIALGALAARRMIGGTPQAFGSVLQGTVRQNVYVGFAAASGLAGETGAALAALCAAIIVPTVNAMSIATLLKLHNGARGDSGPGGGNWMDVLKGLIRHQLILAIALGLIANLSGIGIPPFIDEFTAIVSPAALPIALLTVGAGLRLKALRQAGKAVGVSLALKLAVMPIVVWIVARALGLGGETFLVAMIFSALPTSASGYHMARHMGGDAPLLAAIITAQTLVATVTLPATILLATLAA